MVSILSGSSEPLQRRCRVIAPRRRRFNPQRLVGAAATRPLDRQGPAVRTVSILSGSSEPLQPPAEGRAEDAGPVSILSGSSEPLQRGRPAVGRRSGPGFNPQRLVGAAATGVDGVAPGRRAQFQSSAARRSRCNASRSEDGPRRELFQSSAARRSRCNQGPQPTHDLSVLVSILSGSSEPLQQPISQPVGAALLVSILSGSSEPLQPDWLANAQRAGFRFQSSAARRSRCNASRSAASSRRAERFQSSAARRSRCNSSVRAVASSSTRCFNPQRLVGAAATPRSWPPPTSRPSFNPQRLVGAAATRRSRR